MTQTTDFPLGAIVNGQTFFDRIEALNYENPEQFLNGSEEMIGLKQCFDALVEYANSTKEASC